MPLNLATRILGGEGANRLHQVLRTERGLTYGAQAEMHTLRETGALEASTNTRSEATAEVLRLMVDEFWRLQRDRVGERELTEAKNYMTGSFPLTIETADAIATQVLNVLFYGLPVEQLQSFRERVNAVTTDEVQRVSRFYLRPDRLSIVLVGNSQAFIPQLRRLGFNTFEVVEMNNLDLATPDLIRAGAEKFGSQCIVVSIDAKKTAPQRWEVFSHGGRQATGLEAVAWAEKAVALGAGEIVLNSIDADGTKAGFDLEITSRISDAVGVPVVASGGAGTLEHMADVLLAGKADAVLAASVFHFGEFTVGDVKRFLAGKGIPVRL